VHRFFDLQSAVAEYISVPRPCVILQRINVGLFAVLGELSATANWWAIAEEIWPFAQGPTSTPIGRAGAAWRRRRQAGRGVTREGPVRSAPRRGNVAPSQTRRAAKPISAAHRRCADEACDELLASPPDVKRIDVLAAKLPT
jgi:hypothetical protein